MIGLHKLALQIAAVEALKQPHKNIMIGGAPLENETDVKKSRASALLIEHIINVIHQTVTQKGGLVSLDNDLKISVQDTSCASKTLASYAFIELYIKYKLMELGLNNYDDNLFIESNLVFKINENGHMHDVSTLKASDKTRAPPAPSAPPSSAPPPPPLAPSASSAPPGSKPGTKTEVVFDEQLDSMEVESES